MQRSEQRPSDMLESLPDSFSNRQTYNDAYQSKGPSPAGLERYKTTRNGSDNRGLFQSVS